MRVLVCGGRTFKDFTYVAFVLYALRLNKDDVIITGGAKGADALASKYAKEQGIPEEVYPAEWDKYGHGAGPVRNHRMLKESKPDVVIAFPGGRGTAHMMHIAHKAGIPVTDLNKDAPRDLMEEPTHV